MSKKDFRFSTEVEIKLPKWKLNYQTPMIFIGSCFSDNIGGLLAQYKFPVMSNPYGVLFNPVSILNALYRSINRQLISSDELIKQGNLWHSFIFHGSFSGSDPEKVTSRCNLAITQAHDFLKKTEYLFITFGTAWVYRYIKTGEIVSNCHKIPANQFDRFRLSPEEILQEWQQLMKQLRQFNPNIKVVFTISPVRHLKDGAHENQLSKSALLLATDRIIKENEESMGYFPAYEIVNDELRDYRFYNTDMVHLSEIAVNYIFETFSSFFFTPEAKECYTQVKSIIQSSEHHLLTDDKHSITLFAQSMLTKIETLKNKYPYINFDQQIAHFTRLQA